jgi:hypothetical protein
VAVTLSAVFYWLCTIAIAIAIVMAVLIVFVRLFTSARGDRIVGWFAQDRPEPSQQSRVVARYPRPRPWDWERDGA